MESSPGYPWMRVARTNAGFLEFYGFDNIALMVLSRLRALRDVPFVNAVQAVEDNLCDPIRLFVKNEPHSREKVAQRRFRLIASVSIIDQLVERLLFAAQNKAEIDRWEQIPSKPGMGLHDEGLIALESEMSKFRRPVETDVSGFDWSVKYWALHMDAVARLRLAGYATPITMTPETATTAYEALVLRRVQCLAQAVLLTTDGHVFEQVEPGIQKSGSYNTSSTNSRMRVMMAFMAGAERVMAMGDDCVEELSTHGAQVAQQKYRDMGLLIKEYKETDLVRGIEFCSHIFQRGSWPKPLNWYKSLVHALHVVPRNASHAADVRMGMEEFMRHHSQRGHAMRLLVLSGWGGSTNGGQEA